MDAIALAAITSAVTMIATEAAKKIGSKAGEDLWTKLKGVLGFNSELPPNQLAVTIAKTLNDNPDLASEVTKLLQEPVNSKVSTTASALVSDINAEKVIVIGHSNIHQITL